MRIKQNWYHSSDTLVSGTLSLLVSGCKIFLDREQKRLGCVLPETMLFLFPHKYWRDLAGRHRQSYKKHQGSLPPPPNWSQADWIPSVKVIVLLNSLLYIAPFSGYQQCQPPFTTSVKPAAGKVFPQQSALPLSLSERFGSNPSVLSFK